MNNLNCFLFQKIIFVVVLMAAGACVGEKKPTTQANCEKGFTFDEVSRSCVATGMAPVATLETVSVEENSGKNTIQLNYDDENDDKASSCHVSEDSELMAMVSPRQYELSDESLDLLAIVNQAYNIIAPTAQTARDTAVSAVENIRRATSLSVSLNNRDIFIQAAREVAQAAIDDGGAVAVTTGETLMAETDDYELYFSRLSDRCHCTSGKCSTVLVPKKDETGSTGFVYSITDPNDGPSPDKSVDVTINPEVKRPLPVHHDVVVDESQTSTPLLQTFAAVSALTNGTASYSVIDTTTEGDLNDCFSPFDSPSTCAYTPFDGDMSDEYITADTPRASVEPGEFAELDFQGILYQATSKGEAGNDIRIRYSEYEGVGHRPELDVKVFSDSSGPIVDVVVISDLTTTDDVRDAINDFNNPSSSFVSASLSAPVTFVTTDLVNLSGGEDAQDVFTYRVCEGLICSDYDGSYTIRVQEQDDFPVVDTANSFTTPDPALEDDLFTLQVEYTDSDSALLASDCEVNADDSGELSVVSTCSCDASGVCTADLMSAPDFFGTTSVSVNVDNDGLTSDTSQISLDLGPVNDQPALRENISGTPEHNFADDSILENDGDNIGADERYFSEDFIVDRGDIMNDHLEEPQSLDMEIEILYEDDSFQDVIPQTSEFVEIYFDGELITDEDTDETDPVTATVPNELGTLNFILTADAFRSTNLTDDLKVLVRLKDDGGTANGGVDEVEYEFILEVQNVDFPPTVEEIANVESNEGGLVYSFPFRVTEGGLSNEPGQAMGIKFESDNESLLPSANISVHYDENDNSLPDVSEEKTAAHSVSGFIDLGDGSDAADDHLTVLRLRPKAGESGTSNIKVTVTDGNSEDEMTFALIVHPISAIHGGWAEIKASSHKVYDRGQLDPNRVCDPSPDKCDGGNSCEGTVAPNSTVSADEANAIYYDSANDLCYHATSSGVSSWRQLNTYCEVTSADENSNCSGASCLGEDSPSNLSVTPTEVGQFFFNYDDKTCYRSTATENANDWEVYFPSEVTLGWDDFVMAGSGADSDASIEGWNIYRRKYNEPFDFSSPLNDSTLSASTRQYVDETANFETLYYYLVRPIDSKRSLPTATDDIFSEVRILTPPKSMSFIHRWMVNLEICEKMGETLDSLGVEPSNNFRCSFNGPGALDDGGDKYFDIQRDIFVDRVEVGCPFSRDADAISTCGSNGCIGLGAPTFTTSIDGLVYYDRSSATCYISDSSVSGDWEEAQNSSQAISGSDFIEKGSSALLPPLVNIKQDKAYDFCQARSDIASIDGIIGTMAHELPSRKEQMAYSAAPLDISDSAFGDIERGLSLNSSSKCNSSFASGLEDGFTNSDMPSTSFYYSLPASDSSGIRSLTTGSVPIGASLSTEACSSRYGLQDVYGNVAEWVIDRMTCDSDECQGVISGDADDNLIDPAYTNNFFVDSTNYTPDYYSFDGLLGPCRDIDGDGNCDTTMTEWEIQDKNHGASFLSFVMGLPIHNNFVFDFSNDLISESSLEIGPTSGITNTQLKNDAFILNTAALEEVSNRLGGMATGGGYKNETASGRYTFELIPNEDIAAVAATGGTLFSDDMNTTLEFTAREPGADGNEISVGLISSSSADVSSGTDSLEVSVSGSSIVVEVDSGGASQAKDIKSSIENYTQADNLVIVDIEGDGDPDNTFSAQTGDFLTGGLDAVSSRRDDIGFRCMVPLPPAFYDTDSEHSYSY